MFNIGPGELVVILILALVLLGPDKLPEVARSIGKGMKELRRATEDIRNTVEQEIYHADIDKPAARPPAAPAETFPARTLPIPAAMSPPTGSAPVEAAVAAPTPEPPKPAEPAGVTSTEPPAPAKV